MALRMSSSTAGASQISPLRTPRDFAWPSPTIFNPDESGFNSPTTAQIFDVPISNPTMMLEESNISSPGALRFCRFRSRRRRNTVRETQGRVVCHRQIERSDCFIEPGAFLVNLLPSEQLPVEVFQAECNLTALAGCHDQDFR